MHENLDNFQEFVKQQFSNLAEQMSALVSTVAFTVKRVESMEQSLNIKVVTAVEAKTHNLHSDEMIDHMEPHIDISSSTIVRQRKTIDGLCSVNEMHQKRLKSFTSIVNTLFCVPNNFTPEQVASH